MQVVTDAFTAEERDSVRRVVGNLQVSWKKESLLANRTFTIGVSLIGGSDVIGINPGAIGSPGNYHYFDESEHLLSMSWERGYNMPLGGIVKAMANVSLDNTSGRFTPRYMGGQSELYTSIVPRRPMIINAGFHINGVDEMVPQFAGLVTDQPTVDMRSRTLSMKAADYIDYFQGKYLDNTAMFTGVRTDVAIEDLLVQAGMSTAQYELDAGINTIPFGVIDVGTRFADAIHQLAASENGHFYQDEAGIFRFENRYHWDTAPYNEVQKVILTGQVLNAAAPDTDHLINVVEADVTVRVKQPRRPVLNLSSATLIKPGERKELFVNYDDPMLEVLTPTAGGSESFYIANTSSSGTGTDVTDYVLLKSISNFAQASKLVFENTFTTDVFITRLVISGRAAKVVREVHVRDQADASVTAYEERSLTIDNPFITDPIWAQSFARMLLEDYSHVENLQRLTVRAMPELQLGTLISWQGRHWRVFDIKSTLDPSVGFVQELLLMQRNAVQYFRIGISAIGGSDKIAP